MSRNGFLLLAGVLACTVAGSVSSADDEGKSDSKTENGSEAEKYVSGSSIDFSQELGLNYPSLVTLGARIEQFRTTSPDPVGLSAAAHELSIAENVSGKKAELTSESLLKEAVHMATVRHNSAELKAVMHYVKDEKVRDELETAAHRAGKDEKTRDEQAKAGAKTRGIYHELIVNNRSRQFVRVYYNRRFVGSLRPLGHDHFRIHDHSPHFDLYAKGSRGSRWRLHKHGDFRRFTWNLRSLR